MRSQKQFTLLLSLLLFTFLLTACGTLSSDSTDSKISNESNDSAMPVSEGDTSSEKSNDAEKPLSAIEEMFQQPVLAQDQNELYGYIGADGEYFIPASFRYAEPLKPESLTLVRDADTGLAGYIDVNGNYVVEPQFLQAYSYVNGFAAVATNLDRDNSIYTNWGYLDESGNPITDFIFDDALNFSGGLAAVCLYGRYGYIDMAGEMIMQPSYEGVTSFSGGRAFVSMAWDGDCAMIDEDGSLLTGFDYHLGVQTLYAGNRGAKVNANSEGYYRVEKRDPSNYSLQAVYLDKEGNEVSELSGAVVAGSYGDPTELGVIAVRRFNENGLAMAMTIDELWGIICADGSWHLPPQFPDMLTMFWVQDAASGLYGKIDLDGTWVIPPTYDTLRLEPGILFATKNDIKYVLDTDGTVMLESSELGTYDLEKIGDGVLCARNPDTKECHLIDGDGQIYGEAFNSYSNFYGDRDDGCFVAGHDGLFGVMDTSGSWEIPPKFMALRS